MEENKTNNGNYSIKPYIILLFITTIVSILLLNFTDMKETMDVMMTYDTKVNASVISCDEDVVEYTTYNSKKSAGDRTRKHKYKVYNKIYAFTFNGREYVCPGYKYSMTKREVGDIVPVKIDKTQIEMDMVNDLDLYTIIKLHLGYMVLFGIMGLMFIVSIMSIIVIIISKIRNKDSINV